MRLGGVTALALGFAAAACQSSPAARCHIPYQGINIDSSSLVAPYGCGMGPGQVYRYVATLIEFRSSMVATPLGWCSAGRRSEQSAHHRCLRLLRRRSFRRNTPGSSQLRPDYLRVYLCRKRRRWSRMRWGGQPVRPSSNARARTSGYSWTTTCTAFAETGASIVAECGPLLPASAGRRRWRGLGG